MTDQPDFPFVAATGTPHRRFMAELHATLVFDWYMEIGCRQGKSFAPVRSKTIAVDPKFSIKSNVIGVKPALHLFQQTSDDFFASGFLQTMGIQLSVSFLDGMHLFEYLLRDFINTEKASAPGGVILLHDCCPFDHTMTTRDLDNLPKGPWTGDVWKLIPILRQHRPDLKIDVLDCRPTGVVAVTNLDPGNTVLSDGYDQIVETWTDQPLDPATLYDSFDYRSARQEIDEGFPLFAGVGAVSQVTGIRRITP